MTYKAIWASQPNLNEVERIKLDKDGLDVIQTIIEKYSKEGYDSIPQDELNRFKWAGVYEHKPKDGHFLLRIRIPSGLLNSEQARVLGKIAKDYGRDLIDLTNRQSIQYHWIMVHQLPDIFKRLESIGLSSFEACGDCPRPIVGNPLAGIDRDELMDTSDIVKQVNDFFVLNPDFSNLPRKYKISISANIYNNAHAEIQDVAFTPATKVIEGKETIGFHVQVGGGLSARPYLAKPLNMFVRPEEVLKVAIGVATIFRDFGYREKRHYVRLKFLVEDWGREAFQNKLEEMIGPMLTRGKDLTVGWQAAHFDGVHQQKQEGKSHVGLNVPMGRMSGSELIQLAEIAEEFGSGSLRTTISKNIIISGILNIQVDQVLKHSIFQRLNPFPKRFLSRTMSCTGSEFCDLAIVETKSRARLIAEYLDEHVELDQNVLIHIVGCPNACGHKAIVDIGLQGVLLKTENGTVEGFEIAIGGTLGPGAQFNERLKGRVAADQTAPVLAELLYFYKHNHLEKESFHQFYKRVGVKAFQDKLNEALAQIS